jgi:hypothetical protein
LLAESNHLLVGMHTLLSEIEHFFSDVEKLSRHYPRTDINGGIQAIYCAGYRKIPTVSAALKFAEISHFNKGSNDSTKWQDEH